ncbi:MAG: helix-turn-helix transcriptional regulator [Planctomycetes bacterium]|nr:helix-turn-helix transcriptional regulator [Planctomycetota bacterium]
MIRLLLKNFVSPGRHCHFGRSYVEPRTAPSPHCHDFNEVFWVEEGDGVHLIDGRRQELTVGTVVLVHPEDQHAFTVLPGRTCRMANIAFASETWQHIRRRYFDGAPDLFERTARRDAKLPADRLRQLTDVAGEIAAGGRSLASIERFLLNLVHLYGAPQQGEARDAAPEWLSDAVARLADPAHFFAGPTALVALCDRSAEHVAREVRRCFGKTPTDLANIARMAFAARRLVESSDSILDICFTCGLSNLGHFYRLFRAAHGVTPMEYRERHRRIVQPLD